VDRPLGAVATVMIEIVWWVSKYESIEEVSGPHGFRIEFPEQQRLRRPVT
jgi:hypothetical protein